MKTLLKKTTRHSYPLVYLRGVKAGILEAMLDFIYLPGVVQEDLDGFLLIAQEFQLKGLTGNDDESTQPHKTNYTATQNWKSESKYKSNHSESKFTNMNPTIGSFLVFRPT